LKVSLRVATVAALLLPAPAQAAKWQAIEHIAGRPPLTVSVQENPRIYFRVTADSPLTVTVDGPCRIRLVSRAELPRDVSHPVSYTMRTEEGGKLLKEQATESSAADGVKLGDSKTVICKSRSVAWDLPEGKHRLTISVTGTPSVLVRVFSSSPKRGGAEMISITPVEAARSVTVSEGEKLIPYYTAFPGKPVKFRIVGPTSLELSARLDFDATMRGTQAYRIAITNRGVRIREAQFKTTKATTASYTDLKDRSASKMDSIVIPLGDGVHELSVELLEPRSGSAEIHARVPQPTVGSEE